ncbi:MAG: cupin-like domain-containing protein [Deltaproteobacteria bacterium]|nr:cupin-like domain-containing protein [Deltaproteobacteria bacterium]
MHTRNLTLSPAWRDWLAENLLRGVAAERLLDTLRVNGVPEDEAARRMDELAASPALRSAREATLRAERLERVASLGRVNERLSPDPTRVERLGAVDADAFYERYVATNTPVVLTELASGWPALETWNPRYFAERYGNVEVTMTAEREADPLYDARTAEHSRPILMRDFVQLVEDAESDTNDFYLVAQNRNIEKDALGPLLDDVRHPPGFLNPERVIGGSALWFGPAGTVTALHHDCSNILFTQIYGKKSARLISPLETRLFDGALSMYAMVDPEDLDGATIKRVDLEPGDTLFIPVGWWHDVRALSVSISVAFSNFARDADFAWYRPGDIR